MTKTVTVYTNNNCAYCEMVKKFLQTKKVPFTVINLDNELPEIRQKVIEMSGAMTVPVTVVKNIADGDSQPNIIVGWNPAKLAAAIQGISE